MRMISILVESCDALAHIIHDNIVGKSYDRHSDNEIILSDIGIIYCYLITTKLNKLRIKLLLSIGGFGAVDEALASCDVVHF